MTRARMPSGLHRRAATCALFAATALCSPSLAASDSPQSPTRDAVPMTAKRAGMDEPIDEIRADLPLRRFVELLSKTTGVKLTVDRGHGGPGGPVDIPVQVQLADITLREVLDCVLPNLELSRLRYVCRGDGILIFDPMVLARDDRREMKGRYPVGDLLPALRSKGGDDDVARVLQAILDPLNPSLLCTLTLKEGTLTVEGYARDHWQINMLLRGLRNPVQPGLIGKSGDRLFVAYDQRMYDRLTKVCTKDVGKPVTLDGLVYFLNMAGRANVVYRRGTAIGATGRKVLHPVQVTTKGRRYIDILLGVKDIDAWKGNMLYFEYDGPVVFLGGTLGIRRVMRAYDLSHFIGRKELGKLVAQLDEGDDRQPDLPAAEALGQALKKLGDDRVASVLYEGKMDDEPAIVSFHRGTAIVWATWRGHRRILRLLYDLNARMSPESKQAETAPAGPGTLSRDRGAKGGIQTRDQ